jgi:SET domain-containing protein
MLLVKTRLGKSQFGGIGCFADQELRAGQKIWTFDPSMSFAIRDAQLASGGYPDHFIDLFDSYAIELAHDPGWLFLELDNARFIRDSKTPNTGWIDIASRIAFVFAAYDIHVGEEITFERDDDDD